jgi:hypothetical protein
LPGQNSIGISPRPICNRRQQGLTFCAQIESL